jgi:TolB protein
MSLWQISADGSKSEALLLMKPYSGGLDWPAWSPDGTEIAFVSFASGVSQVHLLNVRLKQERELTSVSDGAYDPSWSPDGKYVAYAARENGQSYLAVNRRADNSQHRLPIAGTLRSPTWSPQGESLAFIRQNGDQFDAQITEISFGDAVSASGVRSIDGSQGIDATAGLSWTT